MPNALHVIPVLHYAVLHRVADGKKASVLLGKAKAKNKTRHLVRGKARRITRCVHHGDFVAHFLMEVLSRNPTEQHHLNNNNNNSTPLAQEGICY